MKKTIIVSMGILFLFSCQNEKNFETTKEIKRNEKGIYVLNEGVWGNNNSSISYIGYDSGNAIADIATTKWKSPLGDTGNSLYEKNDTVYVCVTSSNKIELFRKSTGDHIRSFVFPQNTEPRQSAISNGKLFVTSFLLGSAVVVDLKTFQQTNKIPVGNHPDQMIESDGKLLVSISELGTGNKIAIVDAASEMKIKEVEVGLNPSEIIEIPNCFAVHCSGNLLLDKPKSVLYRLNKNDFSIINSLQTGKQIYQIGNYGTQKLFAVDDNQISLLNEDLSIETTLITRTQVHSKIIYSLLYDSESGILWIASTDTYTVRGWLEGFKNGTKIYGAFQVGVNPGDLLIK